MSDGNEPGHVPSDSSGEVDIGVAELRSIKRIAVASLSVLIVLAAGAVLVPRQGTYFITLDLVLQDFRLLAAGVFLTGLVLIPTGKMHRRIVLSRSGLLLLGLGVAVIAYLGHYGLLFGYDATRDEQLANFDAAIFASGRLVWPIPPEWRADASALNLMFMYPVDHPVAWVSTYLPMNAAIRALFGLVGDSALTNPVLAGLCLPLLWCIARRIWPEDRETATVSTVLLASSGQFVFMAMTAFAMTAHLFFNLLWLWLFLANRRRFDLLALAVGFVATGLHQPVFHPLFVAPWMLLLLVEARWRRLALFVAGYGMIAAFWAYWPHIIVQMVIGPGSVVSGPGSDYWSRFLDAFGRNSDNLVLTAANLLSLCTWQHILALPLLLASWSVLRRDRIAAALGLGVILPIVVIAIILPNQGPGFGYRYLHPALGNVALLAGYGWRSLAKLHDNLRPVFLKATVATVFVLLPMQAWMAREQYAPYALTSRKIDASGADYAFIAMADGVFTPKLIDNRPDLKNRPIRIVADFIPDVDGFAARICQPGTSVALATDAFAGPISDYFNFRKSGGASKRLPKLSETFTKAGCSVKLLR